MTLENFIPKINASIIHETFSKYHLNVPNDFGFSNVNIIIGPNGSGKTRFLKAIKELYSFDSAKDVLYGYFPALSDRKEFSSETRHELPECTLFDAICMDDVSFPDFFKEIELQGEDFIPELLEYHSRRQKERGDNALQLVKDSFSAFTDKTLVVYEHQISIIDASGNHEKLQEALKMMSPGELFLFYMSIFIAIQKNRKNKVIILDEPESHLHPKALLSFVKQLTKNNNDSEIWIATHSLFIIPEFQFENIVYISESQITNRTSQLYQSIISSLLGDDEQKVNMFFSSLSLWQYCEFIDECFTDPTVIDTVNSQDEQVQLFIKYRNEHDTFHVLDCGGGSGRLGLSLEAALFGEKNNIDYDIYDLHPTYNGSKFDVYTDLDEIKVVYDCVVMMNFLHEVDPDEWQDLFKKVYSIMSENAYLFFVEVRALRQGEMPNSKGYYIFGPEELGILFNYKDKITEIRIKDNQKSTCTIVPRSFLRNINQDSIQKAITHLQRRIYNELISIRQINTENASESRKDIKLARKYAFLSQQYINTQLYLDNIQSQKLPQTTNKQPQSSTNQLQSNNAKIIVPTLDSIMNKIYLYRKSNIQVSNSKCDLSTIMDNLNAAYSYFIRMRVALDYQLELCWKNITTMEEHHVDKPFIALYLKALALMGHEKSEKRFVNNNYADYLLT